MKFVFDQVQREGHLLIVELSLNSHLFVRGQSRQQILDLNASVDHQAA